MLASELARELDIDPSAMTRRLTLYHAESRTERERMLSGKTVDDMRRVQCLLDDGEAPTAKQAIQMVLGQYTEPVASGTALIILQRLQWIEEQVLPDVVNRLETVAMTVSRIDEYLHALSQRRAATTTSDPQGSVQGKAE